MTVRQWVAHSGLDPVHQLVGRHPCIRPSRISRPATAICARALYAGAVGVAMGPAPESVLSKFYPETQSKDCRH